MTITRINSPEFQDALTKVLDYLQDKDQRVFNAVSQAFKSAFFLHSLNRSFTPNLCREPASSPRLLGAHRHIAHSSYTGRFQPICSFTIKGHKGKIRFMRLTPDGNTLFTASADKTIKIWDIKTGTCIRTLTGHTSWVESLELTPDGNTLCSASADKTIKIWDIKTGTCIRTLKGHTSRVGIILTLDGNNLFSASNDQTIKVWDIKTGTCIHTLTGHTSSVTYLAPPDGNTLISASADNTMKIWDIKTGTCIRTLTGHTDWIQAIILSPDGNSLISTSSDKTIKIWNIKTGTCIHTLTGHMGEIVTPVLTPDGKKLFSVSFDKTIKIWDMGSHTCIHTLTGHIYDTAGLILSPDGKSLILVSSATIKIWDIYPLLEKSIPHKTPVKTIARVTLLDIGQYLEAIAERNDGQYGELIPAAVPFTIERIKTLPDAIKKEIYAQLKNPTCRSLCIEGDENISDPRSIKHSVEKFFSRMNQLPQDIQDAFYEELHKTAPPDSQYLTMRNALRVASAALGIAAVGTALVGFFTET